MHLFYLCLLVGCGTDVRNFLSFFTVSSQFITAENLLLYKGNREVAFHLSIATLGVIFSAMESIFSGD